MNNVKGIPARGLKPAAVLAQGRPHGILLTYVAGCRCDLCRKANCEYQKARAQAQKGGDWNGLVPADAARAHMIKLSELGVGRRAVHAVTDIADSILFQIRSGQKTQIRARTERRILQVTPEMASDGALVDAKPTWKLINKMIKWGYTKTFIAKALGAKNGNLQIRTGKVEVRTAYEVLRLYQRCKEERLSMAQAAKAERGLAEIKTGTYSPRPGVTIHRIGI
jgi:hypothetical protein